MHKIYRHTHTHTHIHESSNEFDTWADRKKEEEREIKNENTQNLVFIVFNCANTK